MAIRINGVPLLDDRQQLRFQFRLIRGAVVRKPKPAEPTASSHETSGHRFLEPDSGLSTDRPPRAGPEPGSP